MKQALATALQARGYDTLTAVQLAVTDPELEGQDLLVSAQTGSGKTLGFGLAIAPGLLGDNERFDQADAPLALVIAPTRELAIQVKRELAWLYEKAGAVMASTVGGMDMRDERRALARGAHIVVSTPGRLRDHIMRGSIDLGALRAVVLDEADEMLDLGFREDLEFILEAAPQERQTLLFSATVPGSIAKLAQNYQTDAVRIATASATTQHADIDYRAMRVSPRDGENAIINVLRFYEAPNAIVFCNTRAMVNRLTTRLSNRGFSVVALSGELSQSERTHALQAMRDGRARVCVATDVAARGIDLPNLELVIHAELPTSKDTLLHRSGRTGRAGKKGVSALIVPPASRKKAERLLGWAKLKAEWSNAPSADEVQLRDDDRMVERVGLGDGADPATQSSVQKLIEAFSIEQIASAYVSLYRDRHTAPEELADAGAAEKPRAPFGPSIWFSLEGGQKVGAEPRRLLPMICKMGNLSREDVGAIRILPDASLIEIRQSAEDGFISAIGPDMVLEQGAALTKLDKPPAADVIESRQRPKRPRTQDSEQRKPDQDRKREASSQRRDDKPARENSDKKKGTTTPIDWNDAPAPRTKKPKPGSKERTKSDSAHKGKSKKKSETIAEPWKPRKSAKGVDPAANDKPFKKRGPKPPVGKPSSKKNRARQQAKAALKSENGSRANRKPSSKGSGKPKS